MEPEQSQEASRLGIGIIGAGHIASTHARHFSRVPNARLVAIADAQLGKAEALAEKHGADALGSADALLSRGDIDAVVVCIPTDRHRTVVEAALQSGKHVLCEKPMALTLEDCDVMSRAAESAGKVLSVAQVVRQFAEYRQAKHLIETGAIGTPALARTRRGGAFPRSDTDWFAQNERSGGILLDLLVHDFDFLLWCFGPIVRVHAHALSDNPRHALDHLDYALVTLRHQSGVIAHVEGTWADPTPFGTSFEISGDKGLLSHDARRAVTLSRSLRNPDGTARASSAQSPLDLNDDPFYRQAAAFVAAAKGDAHSAVSPQEARAAVRVALAARQSARTGKAVTL